MTSAVVAGLHILFAFLAALFYAGRAHALRPPLTEQTLKDVLRFDGWSGLAALGLYGLGLWRLLGALEKPTDWYLEHPMFWVKMGLVGLAFVFEVPVQIVLLPAQIRASRKKPVVIAPEAAARIRRWNLAGLALLCVLVPIASLMARGVAHPGTAEAEGFCAVEGLFATKCRACHSSTAKLGGLDLQTDARAALVGRPSAQWPSEIRVVPGDPAASLLYKKITGRQGAAHGQRMPLTGTLDRESIELVKQWIEDGAGRCKSN